MDFRLCIWPRTGKRMMISGPFLLIPIFLSLILTTTTLVSPSFIGIVARRCSGSVKWRHGIMRDFIVEWLSIWVLGARGQLIHFTLLWLPSMMPGSTILPPWVRSRSHMHRLPVIVMGGPLLLLTSFLKMMGVLMSMFVVA